MAKKTKCACRKMDLPKAGRILLLCSRHRDKPPKTKRLPCYFDEAGIIRRWEPEVPTSCRVTITKKPGFVYFARFGDLIKIGHSTNPQKRVASLNAELIGFVPGTLQREAAFHSEFELLRERGEWFRADKSLLDRIRELLA